MEYWSDIAFKCAAFLSSAFRSLGRNKLRSFLSVLGVVFGVMAVLAIICIGQGARDEAIRQVEQLGTQNIYLRQIDLTSEQKRMAAMQHAEGLNSRDVDRLKNAEVNIRELASLKELSVAVIGALQQISPQIAACSANYKDILDLNLVAGRFIRQDDIEQHRPVCVLGGEIAHKLGRDGRLNANLRIGDHLFVIVGHLDRVQTDPAASSKISVRNHNEMILLPMGAQQWLPEPKRSLTQASGQDAEFSEIIIQIQDTEHVLASAAVIKRIMSLSHNGVGDYQLVVPLELLEQSQKTQDMFNLFLAAIAGISLIVGGIGIMNIMLATISERKKEIGIRRAVGATQSHIIIQFLTESIILTLTGGVIGVFAGISAVNAIAAVAPWHTSFSLPAVLIPLVMSVFVGLFFGLYPAYQAAAVDPIEALRYE